MFISVLPIINTYSYAAAVLRAAIVMMWVVVLDVLRLVHMTLFRHDLSKIDLIRFCDGWQAVYHYVEIQVGVSSPLCLCGMQVLIM